MEVYRIKRELRDLIEYENKMWEDSNDWNSPHPVEEMEEVQESIAKLREMLEEEEQK